jgi:hypothetical protein
MEETLQRLSKQNSESQALIDSLQKDLTTKYVFFSHFRKIPYDLFCDDCSYSSLSCRESLLASLSKDLQERDKSCEIKQQEFIQLKNLKESLESQIATLNSSLQQQVFTLVIPKVSLFEEMLFQPTKHNYFHKSAKYFL